jgi:hypothetical protein
MSNPQTIPDWMTQPNYSNGDVNGNPQFAKYDEQLQAKLKDTLYQKTATKLGITTLDSWDDIKRIETYLAGAGGSTSGTGSASSGSSGTSSGGTGSSSGSSGSGSSGGSGGSSSSGSSSGDLKQQQQAGQAAAANAQTQTQDLASSLQQLMMSNDSSSRALVESMNAQAKLTSANQAAQQQQLQQILMQGQQQFAASQQLAQLQMQAMQGQVQQMMSAVAEQNKMAENTARAYVPALKETAGYTPVGDLRAGVEKGRASSRLSDIQDLAFLPGASATSKSRTMNNTLVIA